MSNGERWIDIPEFPDYEISDHGNVFSKRNNQPLALSFNTRGHVKVNFSSEGTIHTRSVRVLVAEAFVDVPDDPYTLSEEFFGDLLADHTNRGTDLDVINLDGDPRNNHYTNLAWRPHWFAWKYARQFHVPTPDEYNVPVLNTLTGEAFNNVMEAGVRNGELWEYVYNSAITSRPVYPSGAVYEFLSLGTMSQLKQRL